MSKGQLLRAVAWSMFVATAAIELAAIWTADGRVGLSGSVVFAVAYAAFLAQIGER